MHHERFEAVTLKEYDLITRARIRARDAQVEARRVLNQELGVLVSHAFHNPRKMPDFTKAAGRKGHGKTDPAQELEQLRAGLMNMHFESKKGP
ncbi:hypothetical protein R1T40_09900 [Tritonibacter scottomollicae]|uniref:Uncharacterized protein n=1 Tax=Tritonibacter scottomollicae TaxID=483013 RepID=A0ABZ0HL53_TRISK|nr:hypothetical protein [Tritonibacter scottomollicae]WOI35013.1 hypothetical protein R1T40_09900 [Tritonibacter scottomollicae]